MRARGLNKKVEIWGNTSISDNFGGYIVEDALVATSWAKIETAKTSASKLNDLGLNDMTFNIIVTMRKRNDLSYDSINQFIKYRDEKYMFIVSPINTDFTDSFITLIATKEKTN